MSVIDWKSKPEPWRSMGLKFVRELEALPKAQPVPERECVIDQAVEAGIRLRDARRLRGWSQQELERRSGYDIGHIEAGRVTNPRRRTKAAIAEALGITATDIWLEQNDDEPGDHRVQQEGKT